MAFLLNGSRPIVYLCGQKKKKKVNPISYDVQNKLWINIKYKYERSYNKVLREAKKRLPLRLWCKQK